MIKRKNITVRNSPQFIDDFVCNLSEQQFSNDELKKLNKGLNFSVQTKSVPLADVIVDIETILKFKPLAVQNEIRDATKDIVLKLSSDKRHRKRSEIDFDKAIQELKAKDCVYVKADKGNKVVIMNKRDYEDRALQLINECGYQKLNRSPLSKMITQAHILRKNISSNFGERFKWRL